MITKGDSAAGAIFSGCERYRYRLWRRIGDGVMGRCLFIMLNPSTATHEVVDPTITRCLGYAKAWGYSGLEVCNIFAYRATDPKDMKAQTDPIGPVNDDTIASVALSVESEGGIIVCAWGAHGKHMQRSEAVIKRLQQHDVPLYFLKLNADGEPGHPLYLKSSLTPQAWDDAMFRIRS